MPMGSVSAFYGIKRCMTLLHGSQGCSTYIRRHMATHYNEPVDIASSSLTEQGTVFGGEANLIKGLKNLIALYNPDVIGVATTCLAETIGEDIPRIIRDFYTANPDCRVKIIPVSSAGYAGTQYEGFFSALRAIVANTQMKTEKNKKINVISGMLSPADTRYLKSLFADMGLDVILLPDLSENLDGVFEPNYNRLPEGGTSLDDISQMARARLTIELSTFVSDAYSPAKYLHETYGVPFVRCNLPVGLRDTDALIRLLCEAGGKVSDEIKKQRGRYLDAMVDSHKYNAEGRAAIFGEPDLVYAMARLCTENGLTPVITATGAKCDALKAKLENEIKETAERFFVERFEICDACDFDTIDALIAELNANIMIGNSDGRRIAHQRHLPLIRCAFPVHDMVGGQRMRMIGYEGALTLLDNVTNAILLRKEEGFRDELYQKYYKGPKKELNTIPSALPLSAQKTIAEKTASHPCFNGCGGSFARIHLPVARGCNIQCNYCVRKFDCPNESRPGVTTQVLTPAEALDRYLEVKGKVPNLTVVGIAGPGDALEDFEKTSKTLKMIRMVDSDVTFCLSTNGLMLPQYANEIVELGVSHVTVTVNAVDVKIASRIYKHVRYMGETYTGETAAAILMSNQLAGIKMLTEKGVIVKANIVMLKGINDTHIPKVVEKVKSLGATLTNIMQLIPVKGSAFESMPLVSRKEIMRMREQCGETLQQMMHCRQCRADAVGTLDNDQSAKFSGCTGCAPKTVKKPANKEVSALFAVSSHGGVLVDQHFGQASDFYIYEYMNGVVKFKERRSVGKYCDGSSGCDGKGGGKQMKIEQILDAIKDCACIVTMRMGEAPRHKLTEKGIAVWTSFGRIEDAVADAASAYEEKRMKGII
jgi:nitrogenase molybdenum-iron protein alpha/beta subunit/MoaA/NifB/PqqE/SkfB family radical SAM enzyme